MSTKDLKEKSTEKLESELKGVQALTWALLGIFIVLGVIIIYGFIAKENKIIYISLSAVALSCFSSFLLLSNTMKKIKAELASRKNN